MASINSTSSLGNTALRGFGGLASGIDRDSIIEQMSLGTTTKINNQKKEVTKLQWKQEAYRSISDKLIDWEDKYASYSSSSNLKDPNIFARNIITANGKEESTRYITATGTSSLVNNVSILGVGQLATATVRESNKIYSPNGIVTGIKDLNDGTKYTMSSLQGTQLRFGTPNGADKGGGVSYAATFTFASSYKDADGKTHTIDYTPTSEAGYKQLVDDLNHLLEDSDIKLGETALKDAIRFEYSANGTIQLTKTAKVTDADGNTTEKTLAGLGDYVIQGNSTALKALGYVSGSSGAESDKKDDETDAWTYEANGIDFDEFNRNTTQKFGESATYQEDAISHYTGKKLTFNYNGSKKDIELITEKEAEELRGLSEDQRLVKMQQNLKTRLDRAFGEGKVIVKTTGGNLSFNTVDIQGSSISVTSDDAIMLKNMGIEYGASNKVNLEGKLSQSAIGIGDDSIKNYTVDGKADGELKLTINGVDIKGLTANSSINDILSKINSSDAGVKATYVEATGRFTLVSEETGKGRQIDLGEEDANTNLAWKLFGNTEDTEKKGVTEGQDAVVVVSYGGKSVALERSSNTFNLEGLDVTVSGTFGGVQKDTAAEGGWKVTDTSAAVTFTAKADVDGVVEKVKTFFEDFNALVTEVNTQITTRPDSDYEPLTSEQKDEMDETSIENWEKKAKQGILYGDSAMRDLSVDIQSIFTKLMSNGASYEDLKEIGITYSEDYLDGGTLVFDESAFRAAMESDPEKVSNIFAGGGTVKKGLIDTIDETFTPYATRYSSKNGNSYGRLIEIAGSEKKPTTLLNNEIYNRLKEMQETIDSLQDRLKVEQDRYISQFTTMETMINQMNTQSSYLSQLTA